MLSSSSFRLQFVLLGSALPFLAAVDVFSCFLLLPNRFLEKSGSLFLANLRNAGECLERCHSIHLPRGVPCKSAMWKKDTGDCVLSRYSRFDRFDLFQVAPNLEIDFYENICNGKNRQHAVNRTAVEAGFEVRIRRTTVAPIFARRVHHRRRSIASSPTVEASLNDAPVTEKPKAIRPGPVTPHYYPLRSTSTTTSTATTSTTLTTSTMAESTMVELSPSQRVASLPQPAALALPTQPAASVHPLREPSSHLPSCFHRRAGVVLRGFEEKTLLQKTVADCIQLCLASRNFFCASINYELTRNLCVLNGGSASLNGAALEAAKVDYYENECPQSEESGGVSASVMTGCFASTEGRVLLEFNGHLLRVLSLDACLSECSSRGCAAVNWFPASSSCMLFSPGFSRQFGRAEGSFHENTCFIQNSTIKPKHGHSDPEYYD